jgi:hypothetical protein
LLSPAHRSSLADPNIHPRRGPIPYSDQPGLFSWDWGEQVLRLVVAAITVTGALDRPPSPAVDEPFMRFKPKSIAAYPSRYSSPIACRFLFVIKEFSNMDQ